MLAVEGPNPLNTYVVFGSTIKVLQGLVIGGNFLPTDYFDNLSDARKKANETLENSSPASIETGY